MEFHPPSLPFELVEHIHSFFNYKDGARSATLCRGLYRVWSEMPRIEFDERDFRRPNSFWEVAFKTLQRYDDAKLSIESFTLRLSSIRKSRNHARALIVKAAYIGAQEICIHTRPDGAPFYLNNCVYANEQLKKITFTGGPLQLIWNASAKGKFIKALYLSPNELCGFRDVFHNLLMPYPLLEIFHISGPHSLRFDIARRDNIFHNLKTLSLERTKNTHPSFFDDIFATLPCLKNLSIREILNCYDMQISSQSLENLSIIDPKMTVTASINVPNLRRFHFEGLVMSSFTFGSPHPSPVLVSSIQVECFWFSEFWLCKLHTLLNYLPDSQAFVSVLVNRDIVLVSEEIKVPVEIKEVELLDLRTEAPKPGFVDALFKICLPKAFAINGRVQ